MPIILVIRLLGVALPLTLSGRELLWLPLLFWCAEVHQRLHQVSVGYVRKTGSFRDWLPDIFVQAVKLNHIGHTNKPKPQ